jgi:23S rRNA pseudouridine2605 synthase
MRLHKLLADAGIASRRGAERLVATGHVAVNSRVVTDRGTQVDPAHDMITVDGRPLPAPSAHIYIMLNKPAGVVTTSRDPQGRPTALALVHRPERMFSVGRLDRDTEGLLLLTNDGAWAQRVSHPSGRVEREYEATVDGIPGPDVVARLAAGVVLPDGHVAHGEARVLEALNGRARVSLVLREGYKRQARLMFGAVGLPVRRLMRIRVGGLRLGALDQGAWRLLAPPEVAAVTRPPRERGDDGEQHGLNRHDGEEQRGEHGQRHAARSRRSEVSAGDRNRWSGGVGQVHGGPRPGTGSGTSVPGHGRDVSRGDVARPSARHRPKR